MKNLSQKFKLIVLFLCSALLPIAILSISNIITSIQQIRTMENELLEDQLKNSINATRTYLQHYFGDIEATNDTLVDSNGEDIKDNLEVIDLISNDLNVSATIFIKKDDAYIRYLTSITEHNTDNRIVGTELDKTSEAYKTLQTGNDYVGDVNIQGAAYLSDYTPLKNKNGDTIGLLFVGVSKVETEKMIESHRNTAITTNLTIGSIFIIAGFAFNVILGNTISKPLLMLKDCSIGLAEYDLTKEIPSKLIDRKDEIGTVANGMNLVVMNLREIIGSMHSVSGEVSSVSNELETSCSEAATVAEELAKTITEIADGATSQARSTTECLTKLEDLGKEIQSSLDQMKQLKDASGKAQDYVQEGESVLSQLVCKIDESNEATMAVYQNIQQTSESVQQISEISNMITGIAEQTNLLALNASIEAARAGEHGKGFAVVAEEIRKLAEQSGASTKQIDEHIKLLQENTRQSVDATEKVKDILKEQVLDVNKTEEKYANITESIHNTLTIINELNQSSKEMERGKEDAIGHVHSLSAVAEENAAATEEASACVEEQGASLHEISMNTSGLAETASNLNQIIQKFKI